MDSSLVSHSAVISSLAASLMLFQHLNFGTDGACALTKLIGDYLQPCVFILLDFDRWFVLACYRLCWYLLNCGCWSRAVLLFRASFVFLSVCLDFDPLSWSVLVKTQSRSCFPFWKVKSMRCGWEWPFRPLVIASQLALGVFPWFFSRQDFNSLDFLVPS